jgi:AcrR family transcriptional regulator
VGSHPPEDLTARARIRDAALRLFAERGIAATSIRDIAAEAGVSSGLVRHHFGGKDDLRAACDEYVTTQLQRMREDLLQRGGLADRGFLAAVHPTVLTYQNYLMRSIMDGSDHAARMFDDMIRQGEEWAVANGVETTDLRAFAAVLVAMQAGVFLLSDAVSRALGVDVRSPAGHVRLMRGFVDVFAAPLITPVQVAQIRAALDETQRRETTHPPTPDGDARAPREGDTP